MSNGLVRVVGLGPGSGDHVTRRTWSLMQTAPVVRLRTRIHPAAEALNHPSYDEWYDEADSFELLYGRIVDDLAGLAATSPNGEVLYVVPGSPVVAERTVEMLRERGDIAVVCEPAVSVIDVACATLGIDPMTAGVRVLDALESTEPFRGPGPLLILQTYSPEVLASVADRLPPDTEVTVLHHVGLPDEQLPVMTVRELPRFGAADHLTSLWVPGLRTAGEAIDDLVSFMRELRAKCPWDQEQTHGSLTRHLLEESYEALDALTALDAMIEGGDEDATIVAHAEEELGDVLFQVIFHAELGDEESRFSFATIADAVRDKLTQRHPHVFGDVVVHSSDDVAANWEVLKAVEKGRTSVLDGIAWDLPALALYAKVAAKAKKRGIDLTSSEADEDVVGLLNVVNAALDEGVDLEAALRRYVHRLAALVRDAEESSVASTEAL